MQAILVLSIVLALATPARAQSTIPFFFHHSDVPVTVPGGSTSFFLDQTAPTAVTPTVEEQTVNSGATATFPTFTSPGVGTDTTLLPIASVLLVLSANQKIRACADVSADLLRLDAAGNPTMIGSGTVTSETLPQGKSGGTVGFAGFRVEFPVSDTSVPSGQAIAVAPSLTSHCTANRHVFFTYDGEQAAARVRFQCCFTAQAKCSAGKIKAAGKKASCLLGLDSREAGKGEPADPDKLQKCHDTFSATFAKLDAKGNCINTGDAAFLEPEIDAFVADVDGGLNPTGPPSANKCQELKIKAVAKKATCLLSLKSKAAAKGEFLDPLDPTKVQKCLDKFTATFAKLELKGDCLTTGDAGSTETKVDTFVDSTASALACPCS